MAFKWKDPKKIWKGEGIYHLVFVVVGRQPLLGTLVALADSRAYDTNVNPDQRGRQGGKHTSELATTELSAFGFAVHDHLMELEKRFDDTDICI